MPHRRRSRRLVPITLESLEPRTLLSATLDLVGVHPSLGVVSVTGNRGDGTFNAVHLSTREAGALQTEMHDLDGDGVLDVVVNDGSTQLSVLFGRGDGRFTQAQRVDVGVAMSAFALGDLNDDDVLDIVAAPAAGGDLVILLGLGDGTFDEDEPEFVDISRKVTAMVLADVDRDKDLDILSVNADDDALTVLYNDGPLSYDIEASFAAGVNPNSLAVGDMNLDKYPDVVVTNPSSGRITLLLNSKNGGFFIEDSFLTLNEPTSVVVADLDDDKDLDVIVGDIGNSRRLTVLENIFREADEPEDPFLEISSTPQVPEGSPVSVVLADADSDGDLDFFTGNGFIDGGSASSVSVFLNNGNGTFQLPKSAGRNLGSLSIVVGDTDGDGTPDVVSVGDTLTAVLLGDGKGELFEPLTQTVGQGPVAAVFGNFDNDDTLDADENEDNRLGTTDIVVLNATDNTISILLNQRDGKFDIDREDGTVAVGNAPRQMALGLLDSDDDDDLIVTNSGDQSVTVLRGAANGTFSQRQDFAVGTDVDGVATGDVNGDGFVDVVVGNRDSSFVSVLLGNGNGGLAAPVTFATGMAPAQVAVVDVNGDGRLDIVTLNLESDTISVLLQTLEGGLAAAINTPVDEFAVQLLLVDLNNDTKPDLVTADSQSQQIAVFGGNGDGTFVDPVLIEMVGLPIDVKAGDLNGDNKPDLAVLTSASNAPILFNNGSLQLQVDQTLQMAPDGVTALYIADALPDADFGIFDNNDSLEFRDDDGTLIKVSLSGPGEGRVTQDAFGRILINIEGTSGQTKLNIASQRGGNGVADLHDIIVTGGGLAQIDGKSADLTGTLRVLDGGVNKITLRNVEAERGIQIGAGDNASQTLDLTFNHVKNTSIQSALPIKSLKVSSWLDPNAQSQPDAIVAPWVGTVKAGDFDAGFTLSGVDAPRGLALNSVKARDIKAGIYQIAQGDIGSIKADSIAQAIADDVADGFTESVRFNVAGAIKKLDVKGNAAFDLLAQRAETISVKGDLINSRIRLTLVTEGDEQARALKSLKVGGLVEELLLDSAGSIDTIDVDLIRESRVFLGVTPLQPGQSFPSIDADPFNHDATLRQFKTKRQKDGPDPDDDDEPSFEDTVVAARNIGKLDLQLVKLDNNNTKFGVAADRIDALNFGDSEDDRVRYQLKDLNTAQDVLDQLDNPAALDDFEIRLV